MKVKKVRIRKMTERECFRLMGLRDNEIDKILATGISRANAYKLSGNSIVTDVIENVLRTLLIEKDAEPGQSKALF